LRLRANGRGIEQDLGAEQRHRARRFRKPLIPADRDADRAETRAPHLEAGVARGEVELLVIAGTLRNVRLAIRAEQRTAGVDDGDRVVENVSRALEHADRQYDVQLARELLKSADRRVLLDRHGDLEVLRIVLDAEVRRFEELLNQDDVRALPRGLAHDPLGRGEIRGAVAGTGELSGGYCDFHELLPG